MIYAKCIELKKLIVKFNRKQYDLEHCLQYEYGMFMDGEWSCTITCNGCVDICEFKEIYDFLATSYVSPFMYGSRFGFKVHVQ